MDFHSLLRRDLQFLCKRNKIPANMTNLAMADALKALEIVEGLNEYMNQSDSNVLQSPTSVAKQPPNTATRTTRRKTAIKAEPQSSTHLGNRSCHMTSKSLAGESDQETIIQNVAQEPNTNNVKSQDNVAKTPAARSTRKALAATSCSSKVQESKKDVLVQSVYSTRRSTRLLEKCLADLSLKTKETLDNDKPEKNEETEQNVSAQEKIPADSEERSEDAEVIPGRDLSASMEKEWKMLKNDSDQVTGGLEIYVDIGDIDARNETNNEKMNEVMSDEKESEDSLVQVDKQEETLQADKAICEEGLKKNDNDQEIGDTEVHVDLGDIPALEYANTETNNDNKEWKNDKAFDSLAHQEIGQAIQENDSEPEKINNFDEDTMVDQTDHQEIDQAIQENDSEPEKINNFDEDTMVDQTDHQEIDQAIQENDSEPGKINNFDEDTMVDQTDHQEIDQAIQENDSEPEKINNFDEDKMVDQTDGDGDSETEPEEDNSSVDSDGTISEADSTQAVLVSDTAVEEMNFSESEGSDAAAISPLLLLETEPEEDNSGVDSDGTISEADSNQAVLGPDIAVEEMNLSESEGSAAAPMPPPLLPEEAIVKTAPLSPLAAESISVQFPRPNKSTTTPSKKSAMKLVNVDNKNKENNMEMMMNVNNGDNGESKGEANKTKKKVEIDEENLKDVSMRQLLKMLKELSIKSSNNRTALQILPGNNQIAE